LSTASSSQYWFLDQVEELQAAIGVLLGNGDHQAQMASTILLPGEPSASQWTSHG